MLKSRNALLSALALVSASAFAQDQAVHVVVDGNPVVFPYQQPIFTNDRVLVPLRGVFEKLGASVDWNPSTQTITAKTKRSRVQLTIGQLDASVDNQPVHMDIPATLNGGTTMVPLRFVSEALGAHVIWNAPQHEVDITRTTDYDIPRRDHDHDRDRKVVPPPPPPHRNEVLVMAANSVLPFTLNTRLSSRNAHPGDQFTATINPGRNANYYFIPGNTIAYGSVSYARPRDHDRPGSIELRFDHLVFPNGRTVHLNGELIGLDSGSVRRLPNGMMVSASNDRHDRVVYTGKGPGVGIVIGFHTGQRVADDALAHLLEGAVRARPEREVHDVELTPGTQLGVRLYNDLVIPR
jgi:hypothetical protein